jgi:hypothetical protein
MLATLVEGGVREPDSSHATLPQFKQWARKHKRLALAVCAAKAAAIVTREKVDAYTKPIFESFGFRYSGELSDKMGKHGGPQSGQLIPTPADLYLCDDSRTPEFYAACTAEHKRQGFFKMKPGYCPALVAEHLLIQAENALIEAATPLFGIGVEHVHFEDRTKYLDLLLGACLIKGKV